MTKALLGLLLGLTSFGANALDGNELLAGCTLAVSYMDEKRQPLDNTEFQKLTHCLGLVEGVSFTTALYNSTGSASGLAPALRICAPESGATIGQGARIAVKYLRSNPQLLHLPAPYLVIFAFREAFPCS